MASSNRSSVLYAGQEAHLDNLRDQQDVPKETTSSNGRGGNSFFSMWRSFWIACVEHLSRSAK
jgi:hypothetical protein